MGRQIVKDIDGYERRLINPFEPDPVHINWIDSMVPAAAFGRAASGAPTLTALPAPLAGISAFAFAAGADNNQFGIVQFNHNAKQGPGTLEPHVHWLTETTNVGTVIWELEYSMADIHGVFGASTTITVTCTTTGIILRHEYNDFPEIPVNMTISKLMLLRFGRKGGTDTYTGKAFLGGFDIHHVVDSFGSRQEIVK